MCKRNIQNGMAVRRRTCHCLGGQCLRNSRANKEFKYSSDQSFLIKHLSHLLPILLDLALDESKRLDE